MSAPSATATDLTQVDQVDVFHRVVGNDDVQGAAIANYLEAQGDQGLRGRRRHRPTAPLADKVKTDLGDLVVDSDKVQEKQTDFAATVSKVKAASAGRRLLRRLRRRGRPVPEAAPRGRRHGARSSAATASTVPTSRRLPARTSEGAIVTCPCLPADRPRARSRRTSRRSTAAPRCLRGRGLTTRRTSSSRASRRATTPARTCWSG